MAGLLFQAISRGEAIRRIREKLGFPWPVPERELPLGEASGRRLSRSVSAGAPYPPYSRSTRDGYAVRSRDLVGASPASPLFLRLAGEIPMGEIPEVSLGAEEAIRVYTGGAIPEGADAVLMEEDAAQAGSWIEARRSVTPRENLILRGEEIVAGQVLLRGGDRIDPAAIGILASAGVCRVPCADLRIRILSTGDELVPAENSPPPGSIRDVNSWTIQAYLDRFGFPSERCGIASDDPGELAGRFEEASRGADVLLLSGGSSVGARDGTAALLQALPPPGLIVRGLDIVPGKPTLAGGAAEDRLLVVGLPGHPLSSLVVLISFVLPLLRERIGAEDAPRTLRVPCLEDLFGRTGVEEFYPARLRPEGCLPLPAKSGYVSALRGADGLLRLPADRETIRAGEEVEMWLL